MEPALSTIHDYFEALNWGKAADALPLFAADAALQVPALRQEWTGPAGFLVYWNMWTRALPDRWLEIADLKTADSWGVARYLLRGTQKGLLDTALGVVTPCGREISLPVTEVYDLRDGRFARIHASLDFATLARQLGLMPCVEARPLSLTLAN